MTNSEKNWNKKIDFKNYYHNGRQRERGREEREGKEKEREQSETWACSFADYGDHFCMHLDIKASCCMENLNL